MASSVLVLCLVAIAISSSLAETSDKFKDIYGAVQAGQPGGVNGMLGYKANLAPGLDGRAEISKNLSPNLPPTYNLGLDYNTRKTGASVDVSRNPGIPGFHVNGQDNVNLFRSDDRRTSLDANAYYGQHFQPRTRPDYGVGLQFNHRFGRN